MPGRLARHDGTPRHRLGSPVAGDRAGAPHPGPTEVWDQGQRRQGPQRRPGGDPIRNARAAAAPGGATTQASSRDAEATITARPVSSFLVTIAGFLLPANDTPGDNRDT